VLVVTLAALVLLGFVLAYWTWVWLGPRPVPRAQTAVQPPGRADSSYGLFGNVQRDPNIAAPTGVAIKLLGVAAVSSGRRGYAVLKLEGRQILAVHEGEDVAAGIRLAEVHTDYVILERNGTRETLSWPEKNPPAESPAARSARTPD
jgi:general secretion pathway protein C